MASATLGFSRWTQRRGRQLHRLSNRGKHRAGLLTEKPLRSRCAVRPGEEKVVHGSAAWSLARHIEPSTLMATQGQGAVAPLHLGTRTLQHRGAPLGRSMELVVSLRAPCAHDATGGNPRGAKPLGEFPKRFALTDAASLGHAIERRRGHQLGGHGEGDGRRQVERSDLRSDITRDARAGRLHVRHPALGFCDALHAALAEAFLRGPGAHLLDVPWAIRGDAGAVSAHPALEIDTMVVVTEAPETRLDLCTLLGQALMCTAGRFERLLGLLQTPWRLSGAARTALVGLVPHRGQRRWRLIALRWRLDGRLVGGPLFGRYGTRDRFDPRVLPRA
jgi:hypothetical protein